MKSLILGILALYSPLALGATTLEKSMVECTISVDDVFEEIHLKHIKKQALTEDGLYQQNSFYEYYTLAHIYGDLGDVAQEILGAHAQVEHTLFTSQSAEADGVLAEANRYILAVEFAHSVLEIYLDYQGVNQNGLKTYAMSFGGEGVAVELVQDRVDDILRNSTEYKAGSAILCTSQFDSLDEFLTL